MKPEEIVARLGHLETERKTVEYQWDLIERFVVPGRGKFFRQNKSEHEIDWRRREIYDSTALTAADTLASSLHGSLTSPSTRWFGISLRDTELNEDLEVRKWLDECAEKVWFALQDSNFNLEINETYLDLVSFGANFISEEEVGNATSWEGISFQSVPLLEAFFEEDAEHGVHTFYRRLEMTAVQIVSKFGDKVPQSILDMAMKPEGGIVKHTVIFCVYPRKDRKNADVSRMLAPEVRPYGSKYVLKEGKHQLGEEGGYYEMPVFVPRWKRMNSSKWGRSPAMTSLPTILTLNQLQELIIIAAGKVVDPANLTTERGLLSDLDLNSGGLTVLRNINDLKPYESGARFDVSQLQRKDLVDQIRSIFYVDQLELKESPAMTATEVQVRYELMQRLLGPTLGRLQSDLLDPIIQRTFNLLYRAGQMPEEPNIVTEYKQRGGDGTIDVVYTGALARAQRTDEMAALERWIAQLASLSEVRPDILDWVAWDEIADYSAQILNVPAELRRSKEEVKLERDQKAREQQALMEAEQGRMEGEALKAQGEGVQAVSNATGQDGLSVVQGLSMAQGGPPV